MRSGRGLARSRAAIITDRYGFAPRGGFVHQIGNMLRFLGKRWVLENGADQMGNPHTMYALPKHLGFMLRITWGLSIMDFLRPSLAHGPLLLSLLRDKSYICTRINILCGWAYALACYHQYTAAPMIYTAVAAVPD